MYKKETRNGFETNPLRFLVSFLYDREKGQSFTILWSGDGTISAALDPTK